MFLSRSHAGWMCLAGLLLLVGMVSEVLSKPEFAFKLEAEEEEQSPWERLTEREDKKRTEDPLIVALFERPLVLNGSSRYATQIRELAEDIVDGANGAQQTKQSLVGRILAPFRSSSSNGSERPAMQPSGAEVAAHG